MRIDDIRSPGFLSNSHTLRKEVVKAISFCQIQGEESRQEKLTDLILFFREALQLCDDELPKTEPEEPATVVNHYAAVRPCTIPEKSNVTKSKPGKKSN